MAHRKIILAGIFALLLLPGIFADNMYISSNEAASTAKAMNTINGIKTVKDAVLRWYEDNEDSSGRTPEGRDVMNYTGMNYSIADGREHAEGGDYIITTLNDGYELYAGYKFADKDTDIMPKLAARAEMLGLLNKDGETFSVMNPEAYMRIR